MNWKKRRGYYVGLELPFTLKYSLHRGHLIDDNDSAFFVDYALERRLRVSGIFKVGRQLIAFKHLVFDGYVGIGGAYRSLDYRRLENVGPVMEEDSGYTTKYYGEEIVQEFALGLRLGYWFPVD